ncbi:hypothetical protein [Legionella tunisiensis]|uniref:hypothetical protein n=1 Tax=Legionella tunisiensis TaxID=1034944 RepID=UPI0012EA8F59|nr:hypothetical protein [Legionella tunisiensis]
MHTVSSDEWTTAHTYLDSKPDGTKLPYSSVKGKMKTGKTYLSPERSDHNSLMNIKQRIRLLR